MASKKKNLQGQQEAPPKDKKPGDSTSHSVDGKRLLRWVLVLCVLAEILFLILDATVNYARLSEYTRIRTFCNIAREDGLASWFGTFQTWMVALTLWLTVMVVKRDKQPRLILVGWFILALFFSYMTMDDAAEIHERLGSAFKKHHEQSVKLENPEALGAQALKASPSYAWQVAVLPFFIFMGIFMAFFLWKQLGSMRARFLVGVAFGLYALAISMDFVEGLEPNHPWNLYTHFANTFDIQNYTLRTFNRPPFDTLRHFSKAFEETFEMLSNSILWFVFLEHFMRKAGRLHLRFHFPEGGKHETA